MNQSFELTLSIAKANQNKQFYLNEIALVVDGERAFALQNNRASSYFEYLFSLSNTSPSILRTHFTSALNKFLKNWIPGSTTRRVSEIENILDLIRGYKPSYGVVTTFEIINLLERRSLIEEISDEQSLSLIKDGHISLGVYFSQIYSVNDSSRPAFFDQYIISLEKYVHSANNLLSAICLKRLIQHKAITSLSEKATEFIFAKNNKVVLEIILSYIINNEKFTFLEHLLFQSRKYNYYLHHIYKYIEESGGRIYLSDTKLTIKNAEGGSCEITQADPRFWSETNDYVLSRGTNTTVTRDGAHSRADVETEEQSSENSLMNEIRAILQFNTNP